jgi:hypothetical protein
MSAAAALVLVVMAGLALSGCESSQTRSARLRPAAGARKAEQGLKIGRSDHDVRIESATLLSDARAGRSAAVVVLHNTSARPIAALPLLFTVTGAGGRRLFSNDLPGASADLTTVGSLPAGDTLTWVDDGIVGVAGGRGIDARVGVPPAPALAHAPPPPVMRLAGVHLDRDPVDGVTAVGRVVNPASVPQERLVVFATARRGGRIVAAGRAVVPLVKPGGAGARFTVFFVGDPTGAKLRLQAPAVSIASAP